MAVKFWTKLALLGAVVKKASVDFFYGGCFYLAAAVAFFALLSLIPFFFIVLFLGSQVVGSFHDLYTAAGTILTEALPFYSDILTTEAARIKLGSGIYGLVGFLFIIWIGSLVFDSLEYALNQVFQAPRKRPYLKTKLMGLGIFPVGGFLLLLIFLVSALVNAVGQLPVEKYLPFLGWVQDLAVKIALWFLPYLCLFIILVMVFRLVPAIKVSYTEAFVGAGLATFGWWVEKWVFGLVIVPNPNYGVVYGSLRALIILVLWLYFSVCLVLYAAELLAAHRHLVAPEDADE